MTIGSRKCKFARPLHPRRFDRDYRPQRQGNSGRRGPAEAASRRAGTERSNLRDQHGHRLVVANGHLPERQILTGIGPVPIKQSRVEDGNIIR